MHASRHRHTRGSGNQDPFQALLALLVQCRTLQQLAVAAPHVQVPAEGCCVAHPVAAQRDDATKSRSEDLWPDLQQQQLISYNSSATTAVAAQHLCSYIVTGQLCSQVAALHGWMVICLLGSMLSQQHSSIPLAVPLQICT